MIIYRHHHHRRRWLWHHESSVRHDVLLLAVAAVSREFSGMRSRVKKIEISNFIANLELGGVDDLSHETVFFLHENSYPFQQFSCVVGCSFGDGFSFWIYYNDNITVAVLPPPSPPLCCNNQAIKLYGNESFSPEKQQHRLWQLYDDFFCSSEASGIHFYLHKKKLTREKNGIVWNNEMVFSLPVIVADAWINISN